MVEYRRNAVRRRKGMRVRARGGVVSLEAPLKLQMAAHFSLMLRQMPAIVWSTDRQLKITSSLGAGLAGLNLRPNQTVGMTLYQYFGTRDRAHPHIARHLQALKGKRVSYEAEWQGRWWQTHLEALRDEAGRIIGTIGVTLDITDRKDAELARSRSEQKTRTYAQELTVANKDLESMLDVITHDLKEPMRSIESFSQLLTDFYRPGMEQKTTDYLRRIANASARMRTLLDDIRTLSQARKIEIPRVAISGRVIVDRAMERLHDASRQNGARIRIALVFPTLHVNPVWATQAVYNLLSNAIKFRRGPQPAQVDVAPYRGPEGAGIMVKDRGPGVAARYAQRIFDLFYRAVGREVEGTGAGLAIVRAVAERHGGAAWVRPRTGGGSEFVITFGKNNKAGAAT